MGRIPPPPPPAPLTPEQRRAMLERMAAAAVKASRTVEEDWADYQATTPPELQEQG